MRGHDFVLMGFILLALFSAALAQEPQRANADATYQQLRHVALSGESVSVNKFVLKREGATFTFKSGTFYLLAPVNGKVRSREAHGWRRSGPRSRVSRPWPRRI